MNLQMRCPGIEPGPSAWKADILTTRPTTLLLSNWHTLRYPHDVKHNGFQEGTEKSGHPESNQGPFDTRGCFYSRTLYQLSYVRS